MTPEERFECFWEHWHSISKKPKTDKDAAKKYFLRLKIEEQRLAYMNARKFIEKEMQNKGGRYLKKARTYLSDKNFNDEVFVKKESLPLEFISPYAK